MPIKEDDVVYEDELIQVKVKHNKHGVEFVHAYKYDEEMKDFRYESTIYVGDWKKT